MNLTVIGTRLLLFTDHKAANTIAAKLFSYFRHSIAIHSPLNVRSVCLDISRTFDRVLHDVLICKLKRCGASGQLLALLFSGLLRIKSGELFLTVNVLFGDIYQMEYLSALF